VREVEGASTLLHQQASSLSRRVGENDAKRLELERSLGEAEGLASGEHRRLRFRQLQQTVRRPAESFSLWPVGLILVGGVFAGSVTFVFWKIAGGSYGLAFTAFLAGAGVAASALAWLLYVPGMWELNAIVEQTASRLRAARELGNRLQGELSDVRRLLRSDTQTLDAIRQSLQFQREALLQENWKAMRGPVWEDFLARAFRLLGATVQPTGASGDQGVDLIATIGPRCYAIQAKGYEGSVGNGAVQEAVAGMAHYRCNACAVITNSRFTVSATALAESNRCRLIGEDEVPALVLGQLAW
jgi:hypothetical protein